MVVFPIWINTVKLIILFNIHEQWKAVVDRLEAMSIFVKVAELGSFIRAAESLRMPKASVSTAVQRLETQLGTRLLHRTTRRVQMTQDGTTYYERCRDLLADIGELESMFERGTENVRGRIRVDMPNGVATNWIVPKLPEFLAMYPGVEIELSSTDRLVDLVHEGFDCVIRAGTLRDSGLIARPLGAFTNVNCASPAYLKKYGRPRTLKDLSRHRLVHYVSVLGTKSSGFEYFDGEKYANIEMAGALTVNNGDAYLAACLAGFGIIQTPAIGVKQELKKGSLVEILPKHHSEPLPISLVYPHRRNLGRRVRLFMDWVEKVAKAYIR